MPRWTRSHGVPATVRADLDLSAGERVLAGAAENDGGWVVGTDRALHLGVGRPSMRKLAWEQIDRASWDEDTEQLVVVEVADFGVPQPRHHFALPRPLRLLDLVRERVTASVLLTRHVPLAGSRGLKVIARRSPTRQGDVIWSAWLDDGLDPDDPVVRRAVDEGLAAARAELGQ